VISLRNDGHCGANGGIAIPISSIVPRNQEAPRGNKTLLLHLRKTGRLRGLPYVCLKIESLNCTASKNFASHRDEDDGERIEEMIERARQSMDWVLKEVRGLNFFILLISDSSIARALGWQMPNASFRQSGRYQVDSAHNGPLH